MRTIKPLRLSVVYRTFENAGQPMLTVTEFVGFRLDAPRALQHEVALWKAVGKTWPEQPLDEFMPKTRGEVVMAGSAYVVGEPQPGTNVRLTLKRENKALIDKELVVLGNRTWSSLGMSQPEPFQEMPVTWERAFGGEGFADNPRGRGHRPVEVDGHPVHALPNVEDKQKLLRQPSDKPPPVSFLPVDITSPARMKRTGTYDRKWLETRFPYYPEDFDWEFFNVAPEDQRLNDFIAGSETFRIEGMHPTQRVIEGSLPPVMARAFIEKKSDPGALFEVPMHIDTLVLFPNMLFGVVAFRGTVPVEEDDADDVKTLIGAVDDITERRPVDHFREVQKQREDKDGSPLEMLNDAPLMPGWFAAPQHIEEGWDDMAEHIGIQFHRRKRAEARMAVSFGNAKEKMLAQGLTEEQAEAQIPKIDLTGGDLASSDLSELPALLEKSRKEMQELKVKGEQRRLEEDEKARKLLAAEGRDFDAEREKTLKDAAGPPKVTVTQRLQSMRDELGKLGARGADVSAQQRKIDEMQVEFLELSKKQIIAYRKFGHLKPVAPDPLPPEESSARVTEALARHLRGESLAGFDFTGVDLSGIDLSGADLHEAMFESARFDGAKLVGANLREAMLARSTLDNGDFSEANLTGANLSRSTFQGARFHGADLTDTEYFEANLTGGSFRGATLHRVTFLKAVFGVVDFSEADLKMTVILESDVSGCRFVGMKTDQVNFINTRMDGADFSSAKLVRTGFVEAVGDKVSFVGASFDRIAFMSHCGFPHADFRGATMKLACLRSTDLHDSDFSMVTAEDCDFSACDMQRSKLYRLNAPRSLFVRTDLSHADLKASILMNAVLQKARIFGTDFRGANLFRADLSKVQGDTETNFLDAYLVQITMAGSLSEQKARAQRPGGLT